MVFVVVTLGMAAAVVHNDSTMPAMPESLVSVSVEMPVIESGPEQSKESLTELPEIDPVEPVLESNQPDESRDEGPPFHVTIKTGDNLSMIFMRHGLSATDLHSLVTNDRCSGSLSRLDVGQRLSFDTDEAGTLTNFELSPDPLTTFKYTRDGDAYQCERIERETENRRKYVTGTLSDGDSLIRAAKRNGVRRESTALEFAAILQWDVDFWLETRPGDSFRLLYYEQFVDSEYLKDGEILAVEYVNRGDSYRAVRYRNSNGMVSYYSPKGESMRKAFLRAPLVYKRVSSSFNRKRFHPILKTVRPHLGTDYAAPTGTPVRAVAKGTIEKAAYTRTNGNYVFINHGTAIETRYLHLNKISKGIKPGVIVEQGRIIGTVGSTGMSTGPHLHYEFLVNGVHKNPRTVDLPKADPLTGDELIRFKSDSAELIEALEPEKPSRETIATIPGPS